MTIDEVKMIPSNAMIEVEWRGKVREGRVAEGYNEKNGYFYFHMLTNNGSAWARIKPNHILKVKNNYDI